MTIDLWVGEWYIIITKNKGTGQRPERKIEVIDFEKIFNKISDNRFYVEYINKEDGRNGEGYYVKTREEAEAKKLEMEKVWGAKLWNVIIVEK